MNNKLTIYMAKKNLNKQIENLEDERRILRKQLNTINKQLIKHYQEKLKLNNIKAISIKLQDFIEELEIILDLKAINIDFKVIDLFYNCDIEESNKSMNFFGSTLEIIFENNYCLYAKGIKAFNDLTKIEADGKTLFEHCTIKGNDLLLDKDIDNVILRFDIKQLKCIIFDDEKLIEQAIYSCFNKGKTIDIELKEKEKVLTK